MINFEDKSPRALKISRTPARTEQMPGTYTYVEMGNNVIAMRMMQNCMVYVRFQNANGADKTRNFESRKKLKGIRGKVENAGYAMQDMRFGPVMMENEKENARR